MEEKQKTSAEFFKNEKQFANIVIVTKASPEYVALEEEGIRLEAIPLDSIETYKYHAVTYYVMPEWYTGFYQTLLETYCSDLAERLEAIKQLARFPSLRQAVRSYIYFTPDSEQNLRPAIDMILIHNAS